ncbi:Uncharacterised protein [Mesomycoplasma dispar]|uniref:PDxFFG protein n=1 Tax=Mesomycoplasma dispar TaxID=86660 RepID=A0AAJ5NL63_9BACT|nr:PDxFFG protein [Mesomycoplasma dispar]AJR12092.1 hypothetical protein MDIS_01255 [Mesomycoplasma dispar]VEU61458.1 Uncharacterised protein [Mesomycoplasma dispar]
MKKTNILLSYLLAGGALTGVSAGLMGGIKLYSINNELGVYNIDVQSDESVETKKNQLVYANFRNAQGEKVATFEITADSSQNSGTILLDPKIKSAKRRFSETEFADWFAENYDRQTPIFELKIGVMKFVNEYWDALLPSEFVKYAHWFNKNVSWGPDAITLEHFALKKGVTRSGNNLLLGQHSTERKEETKIEFYPDSFFGSFPIFSNLSGTGNGADNLTYKIFSDAISKESLDKYFATIPTQQVLANYDRSKVIAGLPAVELIVNEKIYIYDLVKILKNSFSDNEELSKKLAQFEGNEYFFVFENEGQNLDKVKKKFELATLMFAHEKELQLPQNFSLNFPDDFGKTYKIRSVSNLVNPTLKNDRNNIPQGVLALDLEDWTNNVENSSPNLPNGPRFLLNQKVNSDTTTLLVAEIASKVNQKAENIAKEGFFDLYNIDHPVGRTIGVYQKTPENIVFLPTNPNNPSVEAENEFLSDFDSSLWSIYKINSTKKLSNFKLEVELSDPKNPENNVKTVTFDLDPQGKNYAKNLEEFNTFKIAVDWKNRVVPKIIQEIETLKDGKTTTVYQLYGEVFDGLIDKVLKHKKTNGESLFGTYVDSEIDPQTGLKKYVSKRGNFIGYSHSSRIPYIALLKASSPFFKTTGINYLKYVGAHEYGHHQTLNYAQDNSDPDSSVVLNALSTNSGVSLQSFYNLDVLQTYLQARSSGLNLRKSTPDLNPEKNGIYPNFSFDNENNFEDESSIYGSKENQSIDQLISQKSRRFLQTIEGLQNAANLRKLKLYDLFLLNSIDPESGTINPAISGAAQFFRSGEPNSSENSPTGFINSFETNKLFSNSLTDAMGNLLEFDEFGKLKVADYTPDFATRTFSDLKVKVFFENGKPAIDPSVFKNPTSLTELLAKIDQIQKAFSSKVVPNFQNNGWNSSGQSFARFSLSVGYFAKSLSSILSNQVENQAFFGTIIGNNSRNVKVKVEIPDSLFDVSKVLSEVQKSEQIPKDVKDLAQNLIKKEKEGFKFLNLFNLFKKTDEDSTGSFALSQIFKGESSDLDLKNKIKDLFQKVFDANSIENSDLFASLKNITNFKDSLFRKIAAVVDSLKTLYSVYLSSLATKLISPNNASERASQILKLYLDAIFQDIILQNLSKIFIFQDENGQKVVPNYLLRSLANIYLVKSNSRERNISNLTSGPIFASSYFGKIISVNDQQYYQNPKYDFYAAINSSGKHDNVLDQSEFVNNSDLSTHWTSPLGKLLKFNQVGQKVEKTEELNPFFGIAQDFKFKVGSNNQLDTSKIYLDAWDKTVFGFDYENNYFAYQNNQKETEFSNISDFIEFISIDPFALTIDKKNDEFIRNWDLGYVNSKFNLYKFAYDNLVKNFATKSDQNLDFTWKKDTNSSEILEKLRANFEISEEVLKENLQKYANFLMEAFEKSTLNLLIKNSKIENKNIDHLFLSSVGFMGFKNFARKTRDNLPSTKFGQLTNLDRIQIPWLSFGSFTESNSLVYDDESFVGDDIKNSNKSQVYQWILDLLKEKNIEFKEAELDLFKLQYLVGTKTFVDYTTKERDIKNQFQRMNTDLELSWLRSKNVARYETKPDDFFSNYVYNFPESLTRDYVQIHYSPSNETLDNVSPWFKNISEWNTGNEYFVDGIYTRKWIKNFIPAFEMAQGYSQTLFSHFTNYFLTNFVVSKDSENLNNLYENLTKIFKKAQSQNLYEKAEKLTIEQNSQIEKIRSEEMPSKFIDLTLKTIENNGKIEKITSATQRQKDDIFSEISIEINRILQNYRGELANYQNYNRENIQPVVGNFRWRNGYINKDVSTNNGFFKDRFQRKVLNWELYDDNLEPVVDQNIRITNLKGEKVNNRPEAFWYYSLKAQGVGKRSVSGIWRDSKQDKVAFWGFLKNQDADKVHFLTLEDEITGQKFYIKLTNKGTNNIFYLKKQADLSTKWSLEDEGYKSWVSSWSIIGEFKNALLRPGFEGKRRFRIYFSDEKRQEIKDLFTLGNTKFLAENGKNYQLAPTYIEQNQKGAYLVIRPQFK